VRLNDGSLAWRAWPLRKRPGLGAAAAVIAAGTVWGVWSWTASAFLCVLAAVLLAACVGPFYLPTQYRLTRDGVEIARGLRSRRRAWSEFRTFDGDIEAIVLAPPRSRLWPSREETLFLEGNGEEVRAYVEEMVAAVPGAGRG
jgi:hypothetical protein